VIDSTFRVDADALFETIASRITVEPNGCWTVGNGEYPTITVAGHKVKLHRLMYWMCRGPIRPGFDVEHACHTRDDTCPGAPHHSRFSTARVCVHRRCIRPDHLHACTHAENLRRGREQRARHRAWLRTGEQSSIPARPDLLPDQPGPWLFLVHDADSEHAG
jgi:hypothetical protein